MSVEFSAKKHTARTLARSGLFSLLLGSAVMLGVAAPQAVRAGQPEDEGWLVEAVIRRHAEISGFPASKSTDAKRVTDPTTATEKIR